MHVTRIIADLHVTDIDAAKRFYTDYLGLSAEEFNMGWVARYTSPATGANVQLVTRDAAAPEDPVSPCSPMTSMAPTKTPSDLATRSCTRSRPNPGERAGSSSGPRTATSSIS